MSTISVRRPHSMGPTEVRVLAERLARHVEQKHDVRWRWTGRDAIELSAPPGPASGATGRVTIGDVEVAIEIHLPVALRPVKRLVQARLQAKLDDVLKAG